MQRSFSRLWDGFKSDKEALKARNEYAKELRKQGKKVYCFTLRDQLKKYDSLGVENGGVCNCYFAEVRD